MTNGIWAPPANTSAVECSGLSRAAALLGAANGHFLDMELVHLSNLMQSLVMHYHNLAYAKMCGVKSIDPNGRWASNGSTVATLEEEQQDAGGDGMGQSVSTPTRQTRQTPRMGLGSTSAQLRSPPSSTSGLLLPQRPGFDDSVCKPTTGRCCRLLIFLYICAKLCHWSFEPFNFYSMEHTAAKGIDPFNCHEYLISFKAMPSAKYYIVVSRPKLGWCIDIANVSRDNARSRQRIHKMRHRRIHSTD